MALQALLMEQRAVGHYGAGNRDEDAATHVTDKVDDSGDLIRGFSWQADIRGVRDRDEAEGDRDHQNNA